MTKLSMSEKLAGKPPSLAALTDIVENFLQEILGSRLSAAERVMVLTGAAATASGMARYLVENNMESTK